jgi:bifunctional N-acetylglucosamine-1-phosphate-uridyltransferase/glucosamine-1-phosphate-acetyltransferase GlmU-like protein
MFPTESLLDLDHTDHRKLFENTVNAWDALKQIGSYLQFRLQPAIQGRLIGKPFISGAVFIGKGTVIEHGAMIKGPAWIGEGCEIRNGCYIRENVIVGNGVIMGNSSEFKNCIIFDEAEIPHFNYVGDSIVGYKGHLAAGVILSNVRLDRAEITVTHKGGHHPHGPAKIRRHHWRPRRDRLQLGPFSRFNHRPQLPHVPRHPMARRVASIFGLCKARRGSIPLVGL